MGSIHCSFPSMPQGKTGHMCGAVNSESGSAIEIIVAGGYGGPPVYIFSIEDNAWRIGERYFQISNVAIPVCIEWSPGFLIVGASNVISTTWH